MKAFDLKSGNFYKYVPDGCLYVLQKLPDIEAWILVNSEFANNISQWCATSKTAVGAFGGCLELFVPYLYILDSIHSAAQWPKGTIGIDNDISTDEQRFGGASHAKAICYRLLNHGFGGDKKIFPEKTWVEYRFTNGHVVKEEVSIASRQRQ